MDGKKTLIIGLTGNLLSDQRMQRIASALQQSSYEVEVYFRQYFKYKSNIPKTNPEYPYRAVGLKPPVNSGPLFYFSYNLILFFKLLFKPADIYYAVDSDTLPAFSLLSLLRQKKLVYDAHEYFAEVPELAGNGIKKKIWHLLTRIGVKRAGICISVGEALCIELEKVYGKKFHCIRNVPELNPPARHTTYDKKTILYQGALNSGRMLEMLIKAMDSLPDYHCIIAGEGDLSAALRKAAEGKQNIEFKGLLTPAQLRELTPASYAGFNLLDAGNSLSYYYSLSNKYFDYMHAGVPSISSELPEYLKLNEKWKCGVCIDNTEAALIKLLSDWKNNPALYEGLKENAKFASENNNWEIEKLKLINILND